MYTIGQGWAKPLPGIIAKKNIIMTRSLRLIVPDAAHVPSYAAALAEGHRCGGDPITPADEVLVIQSAPELFIADLLGAKPATLVNAKGETVERVPETVLWLVEDGAFIGDANIRHKLNAHLERSGGHIGYGIRPSRQKQGYATQMLRLCLIWARENLGLERALLSCLADNAASARVMEKNGGSLIDVTPHPLHDGKMQKRYWVPAPQLVT
jgi:predicted acetyltransferase